MFECVLEAPVPFDARVQMVQHVLVLLAHELAYLGAFTAAHCVESVEGQSLLGRTTDDLALRDEAPGEHVPLLVDVHSELRLEVVADQPVDDVPAHESGAHT